MPGSVNNPVQLDPFQMIRSVSWAVGKIRFEITHGAGWGGVVVTASVPISGITKTQTIDNDGASRDPFSDDYTVRDLIGPILVRPDPLLVDFSASGEGIVAITVTTLDGADVEVETKTSDPLNDPQGEPDDPAYFTGVTFSIPVSGEITFTMTG